MFAFIASHTTYCRDHVHNVLMANSLAMLHQIQGHRRQIVLGRHKRGSYDRITTSTVFRHMKEV